MEEVWKEASVSRYFISNLGRIKGRSGKILKVYLSGEKNPYLHICVYPNGRGFKPKLLKIHQEVAKAFIPNPNNLTIINHKDGNKLNNIVTNLEWCTQQENVKHAFDTGLIVQKKGFESPFHKLTIKDVEYIRKHYIPGDSEFGSRALGRKFNIEHSIILDIVKNKRYL